MKKVIPKKTLWTAVIIIMMVLTVLGVILYLYNNQTQFNRSLSGHGYSVLSVAFSPDGSTLASGSKDAIKLWNIED